MVWLMLAGAILSEVTATIMLKISDGLTRWLPSTVVLLGYVVSFVLLAQVLKRGLAVGVAYAIWAAVGVSLVALFGVVFLGESLTWVQVLGLALVIAGVVAVESGTTAH
jgi:small multidrug resistance pump